MVKIIKTSVMVISYKITHFIIIHLIIIHLESKNIREEKDDAW